MTSKKKQSKVKKVKEKALEKVADRYIKQHELNEKLSKYSMSTDFLRKL